MNFSKVATLIALVSALAFPAATFAAETGADADLGGDIIVNPYNDVGRPFPPARPNSVSASSRSETHLDASGSALTASSSGGYGSAGSVRSGETDISADARITVNASDENVRDSTSTVPASAADVSTSDDFTAYAHAQMTSDTDIRSVTAGSDSVSVKYAIPAKLFGFIPMTANETVTVTSAGSVEVERPWYGFLMSADDASIRSAVNTRIAGFSAASSSLTLSERAHLVEAIGSSIRAAASGSASY